MCELEVILLLPMHSNLSNKSSLTNFPFSFSCMIRMKTICCDTVDHRVQINIKNLAETLLWDRDFIFCSIEHRTLNTSTEPALFFVELPSVCDLFPGPVNFDNFFQMQRRTNSPEVTKAVNCSVPVAIWILINSRLKAY